ncbi:MULTISPECIES: hypothetical protein [Streptacidiphilus]|uniref:Carboxypeptidase regulatory-like domain-containing protein n=1 Tax=Streptacidiphilus cavernicola TaxID=3342716 RepID=A0ABV6US16_9ACTN|nr:hypothetical protein [Streptacidiphilus jeojiense]
MIIGPVRRRLLGAAATVSAGVLLAACGGSGAASSQGTASGGTSGGGGPGTTAASPTASPTPTEMTTSQYVAAVATIDRPVSAALSAVATGGSKARLNAAATALQTAAGRLDAVAAPAEAAQDTQDLSQKLKTLAGDLQSLAQGQDSDGNPVCAAASPAVQAGKAGSLAALSTQLKAMAAAGHPAGITVPSFPKQQKRSLSTGTYLRDTDRSGNGRLTIENGGDGDAVITLTRSGSRSFAVYIRKNGSYTVRGVRDGTYTVYFTTGSDWDSGRKGFTSGCAYQKFDDTLKFTTKYTSTQIEYTTYTLSLYAVVGGTARTSDVPPGQFPAP